MEPAKPRRYAAQRTPIGSSKPPPKAAFDDRPGTTEPLTGDRSTSVRNRLLATELSTPNKGGRGEPTEAPESYGRGRPRGPRSVLSSIRRVRHRRTRSRIRSGFEERICRWPQHRPRYVAGLPVIERDRTGGSRRMRFRPITAVFVRHEPGGGMMATAKGELKHRFADGLADLEQAVQRGSNHIATSDMSNYL